jgi:NAD(P)H dehydrogenase (quinone)
MDTVIILYYSKAGNTKALAKRVHEIFTALLPKNLDVKMMSADEMDLTALKAAVGLIVGSPDYFSYPAGKIKYFFDEIYAVRDENKKKPIFGFITHGGGGKALKPLQELCTSCKYKVITPFISVQEEKEISRKDEAQIEKNCKEMLKLLGKDDIIQY